MAPDDGGLEPPALEKAPEARPCARCRAARSLDRPFRDALCAECHRHVLRRGAERFRNLAAAALGLALGMTIALLGPFESVRPANLHRDVACCTVALIWPLSFLGVFLVAGFFERLGLARRPTDLEP